MGWQDDAFWDDPDGRFYAIGSEPRRKFYKCKYCGVSGLCWVKVEAEVKRQSGWKLYEGDKPHFCKRIVRKRNGVVI